MEGLLKTEILQLGAVAVLFLFAIKEFFGYLKVRKAKEDKPENENDNLKLILSELQKMNSNHLHSIEACIGTGNQQLVKTIHDDNTKMIELLGEIKGVLSK